MFGCAQDSLVGTLRENQTPHVWLSSAPPEGSMSDYTLHLFWGGWDPDGNIAYFEYAITDNENGIFDPADTTGSANWYKVYGNDSTFTFTADILADSTSTAGNHLRPVDFIESHTFFIRAVDDEGLASEKPEYRSFTARTLSPVVDILVPMRTGTNPALVPPISTFKWLGKDYISNERQVQDPDSVRWIMVSTVVFGDSWSNTIAYVRTNPDAPEWSDWHFYRALGDTGKTWTTNPLEFGAYIFAVQVKDEAGAVSAVFDEARNIRRVLVSQRATGPKLTVFNQYMGTLVTTSPATPPVIVDLPAGVPMSFRFSADASGYGGITSGYRYGWDIQDLKVPSQWEIDYTPFVLFIDDVPTAESPARTFEFDTHTFHIEVIDNSGFTSRASIKINVVPFTMRKNLLVVDDYDEKNSAGFDQTNGGMPSDEEHDTFWLDVLRNLEGFDPVVDMIEVEGELPVQDVADYKSIIWNSLGGYNLQFGVSLLPDVIKFVSDDPALAGEISGKVTPNILALYMAAGGHVLLCGEQPMTGAINRTVFAAVNASPGYPIIFRYELGGDQDGSYEDSNVGVSGVGELSFAYNECCLNVLDVSVISNRRLIRRFPAHSCAVNFARDHSSLTDGLRFTIPVDTALIDTLRFPALELRPEVAELGRSYSPDARGLINDVYNPPYFQSTCPLVAETEPPRECFQPIYGHGCLNTSSVIYNAPVGFWSSTFADRVPDVPDGVAARSAIWGFAPVFFKPEQVRKAIELILKEWQLPVHESSPSKP